MTIGQRLVLLRKLIEISQKEMAMLFGCTQANISLYEKDETSLPLKYMQVLKKVYNLSIEWLITGEGDMFYNEAVAKAENSKKIDELKQKINQQAAEIKNLQKNIDDLESKNRDLSNEVLTLLRKLTECQEMIMIKNSNPKQTRKSS